MDPSLSIQQKQMLLSKMGQRRAKGDSAMQSDMSKGAHHKSCLSSVPSRATISRFIFARENIMGIDNSSAAKTRRIQELANTHLEEALVAWLSGKSCNVVQRNGVLLCRKSGELQTEANEVLEKDEQFKLKFSNGWEPCFQKQQNLMI